MARNVGYADASYFIKLFKQQEGLTPLIFRSTHIGLFPVGIEGGKCDNRFKGH
ncbi:MAG: AraC family transcriptional regulator [Paenibacillaceae bacterium]